MIKDLVHMQTHHKHSFKAIGQAPLLLAICRFANEICDGERYGLDNQ